MADALLAVWQDISQSLTTTVLDQYASNVLSNVYHVTHSLTAASAQSAIPSIYQLPSAFLSVHSAHINIIIPPYWLILVLPVLLPMDVWIVCLIRLWIIHQVVSCAQLGIICWRVSATLLVLLAITAPQHNAADVMHHVYSVHQLRRVLDAIMGQHSTHPPVLAHPIAHPPNSTNPQHAPAKHAPSSVINVLAIDLISVYRVLHPWC